MCIRDRFLIANYDYLNVASSHALNIHDFIFEYAVSLIPRSYWNNRFQNLAQDLGSSPAPVSYTHLRRYPP